MSETNEGCAIDARPRGCSCSPDDYRPRPCPRQHAYRDCWWQAMSAAKPIEDWHEDYGPVMWWFRDMGEPPYCGTPNDSDWPDYHTHWTPIPPMPFLPTP